MQFLTTDELKLNAIDAEDPEVADYNELPEVNRCVRAQKTTSEERNNYLQQAVVV